MGTLLLIRHGQASYGEEDYDRLSTRGEGQARALGNFLSTVRLDHVFVGPLRRQQSTAQIAAEVAGNLPGAVTVAELAEYPAFEVLHNFMPKLVAENPKFAALTTTPSRELANEAFQMIMNRWARDEWQAEGVETVGMFRQRVQSGLEHVMRGAASGATIAVITSAGPIGVAVGLTFDASDHHMIRASGVIRNASITQLKFRSRAHGWQAERVTLVSFNDTHHLPPELHTEY